MAKQSASTQDAKTGAPFDGRPAVIAATNKATAGTPSAVIAASGADDTRLVCNYLHASIACGATDQTPVSVQLLDDTTVIWEGVLAAPAKGSAEISLHGIDIPGTPNKSMTLAFSAGLAANVVGCVSLGAYHAVLTP